MGYLRLEGAFYALIGCLFLLYGFYRAVQRPGMSVVLTVISLGTRVALAYALAQKPLVLLHPTELTTMRIGGPFRTG